MPARSIYRTLDRPIDQNDVTQWPSLPGQRQRPQESPATSGSAVDWKLVRKKDPVNHILPMTTRWLEALPEDVRPMALVERYPRIANVFALVWSSASECRAYFDELLIDRRGKRKGFPEEVHRDLMKLHDHYGRCRPDAAIRR